MTPTERLRIEQRRELRRVIASERKRRAKRAEREQDEAQMMRGYSIG